MRENSAECEKAAYESLFATTTVRSNPRKINWLAAGALLNNRHGAVEAQFHQKPERFHNLYLHRAHQRDPGTRHEYRFFPSGAMQNLPPCEQVQSASPPQGHPEAEVSAVGSFSPRAVIPRETSEFGRAKGQSPTILRSSQLGHSVFGPLKPVRRHILCSAKQSRF